MNTKEYVQSLFKDYEETEGLKDFMEELQSNLEARITSLTRKGLADNEAFDRACGELGDISVLADELSLKKRREVFEEAYMDIQKYMDTKRVTAYVIFGIIAVFGIIIALIVYFSTRQLLDFKLNNMSAIAAPMPFILASLTGFTFLGLTQETKSHFPMTKKRAAWYAAAAGLIGFGLFAIPITYFSNLHAERSFTLMASIGALIPFALPGCGILCFLVLSEKKRFKPWAASLHEETVRQHLELFKDPVESSRFGIFSGAIWIFAIALFFFFGFLLGFAYSWVVFIFAVGIQLLVQGLMIKRNK